MQECVVEVGAFEGWHAAIFTSLPVEDEVYGDETAAEDRAAVDKALC